MAQKDDSSCEMKCFAGYSFMMKFYLISLLFLLQEAYFNTIFIYKRYIKNLIEIFITRKNFLYIHSTFGGHFHYTFI